MPVRNTEGALARQLEDLQPASPETTAEDLVAMVREVLTSLDGDFNATDARLYAELQWFVEHIERTRKEIAALQPETISGVQIPLASDHLDAIVAATESATHDIMEAAEAIEGVAEQLDAHLSAPLVEATTRIYEACSFQDITGQRISKIVGALKSIEGKVAALISTITAGKSAVDAEPAEAEAVAVDDADPDAALLNGPQLPENAQDQASIDALFDSLK